jgi:hypothetical protein
MINKCKAGNCSADCVGGCGCIAASDDPDACSCYCTDFPGGALKKRALRKIKANSKVTLMVKDLPIAHLASLFDQILPGQIAIPANLALTKVSATHRNKALTDVVKATGLIFLNDAS